MNHHLTRYRSLARALDARFRIPGTPVRFGWDAVLGLVPGVGDAIAGLLGGYGLYVGTRLGAPWIVLARMLFNLLVDLLVGALPVAGDIFDVAWRGNLRNLALLEHWLERPHQTRARSMALLAGFFGVLVAAGALALWLTLLLFRMLLSL
jgi:Domain of unknown function (DUF4112)